MRVPGIKTAKTFSRWVQARLLGGALILGYHRVASVTHDEYEVCVTPQHFAEQMEMLGKYVRPMQLSKLVQYLKEGSLPPQSITVTFDDGYADNLSEAKPILEKYAIPATVFVCSGYMGKEFWWDELERLVMSSNAELSGLRLQVGKNQFMWSQPDVSPEAVLDVRRKFRHALYNFLLMLDVEEQDLVMKTIRNWSGVSSQKIITRAMNHDELLQLADDGLIEIGAHTRHHPMLPRLSLERQKDEIVSSKHELEEKLGKRIHGFAYPNGRATDDAKRIVREAGFAFACTSLHDVVRPVSDPHELTRFWQKDVGGEIFLRGLRLWMKGG
jgi:peptidoglycan/xylan/chitin deacetylase (PgdA/CDA1 family)